MLLDKQCKYCKKKFSNIEGRVFSNHVRWCDKNTTNGDKGLSKLRSTFEKKKKKKKSLEGKFSLVCSNEKCKKSFFVFEQSDKFPSKEKYFCSRSCANSRVHSKKTKERISSGIQKFITEKENQGVIKKQLSKNCLFCNNTFCTRKNNQRFCSISCSMKYRYRNKTKFREYWCQCQFDFSLKDYPDKFDFTLIEKFGWYSAKNRGNNLGGVSRDHMISIAFGFKNNIDPKIISHPANCRLMQQTENSKKYINSSITLEELLKRIEEW